MHYKTKEAAVKKYSNHASDPVADITAAIRIDYPEATEDEIADIIKGSRSPKITMADASVLAAPFDVSQITPEGLKTLQPSKNEAIKEKLSAFDYENLTGERFRDYCLFVQSLQLEDPYDFDQYSVEVVKKVRYRGVKDSPTDVVGFKLNSTKPVNTTRIPVKFAILQNGRVRADAEENFFETIGSQLEHNGKNGRYYLLKK